MGLRILMVNKYLYPRGGAETYLLRLGERLREMGHLVDYFGMADGRNTVENSAGQAAVPMDFHSRGAERFLYPFRILYSFDARRKLKRAAETFRPDVIHLNNLYYHLTPSVIDGAAELGIPMVQTVHDLQLLCPSHIMRRRNGELCDRCAEGSKWHCAAGRCIHGSLVKSVLGSLEGSLYRRMDTYGKVSRFICPSRFLEGMLLRDRRFRGKTLVMQNFVRPPEPSRPCRERGEYVLYFGRLSEEKGILPLLEICRRLPEIPFLFAGSGPLEQAVREAGLPNARCLGFQEEPALREWIRGARFSVSFPQMYENCPLSVLESQALGTPVVSSPMGGVTELIEDNRTGLLVDPGRPEQCAEAIRALYHDRERLERLSESCAGLPLTTLDRYCGELVELYQTVIREVKGG